MWSLAPILLLVVVAWVIAVGLMVMCFCVPAAIGDEQNYNAQIEAEAAKGIEQVEQWLAERETAI